MSESIVIKSDGNKTIEQVRAEVAAFEANPIEPGAPNVSTTPVVNAAATEKTPEKTALPEPVKTPPVEEPAKPAQQPKETTEKAATVTPKAAEPEKETDWKSAYQSLQRKYNKTFIEKKTEQPVVEKPQAPVIPEDVAFQITPESKQRILADIEKDPVEAIIRLTQAIARQEVTPVRSRLENEDAMKLEMSKLEGIDRLVAEGHSWLHTDDGMRKMDEVFAANPELLNTRDPYRAAMGFIQDAPSMTRQRGPAQATGLTPILGASSAVPPVVSTPAASKVDTLQSLLGEMNQALSRGNLKKAQEIQAKMDDIDRG